MLSNLPTNLPTCFICSPLTDGGRVVGVSEEYLRGGVGEAAAAGLELVAGVELVREAKVRQLHDAKLLEEHHVLGLQVPVNKSGRI